MSTIADRQRKNHRNNEDSYHLVENLSCYRSCGLRWCDRKVRNSYLGHVSLLLGLLSAQLIIRLGNIFGIKLQGSQDISKSRLNPQVVQSLLQRWNNRTVSFAVFEIDCERSQPIPAVYLPAGLLALALGSCCTRHLAVLPRTLHFAMSAAALLRITDPYGRVASASANT